MGENTLVHRKHVLSISDHVDGNIVCIAYDAQSTPSFYYNVNLLIHL